MFKHDKKTINDCINFLKEYGWDSDSLLRLVKSTAIDVVQLGTVVKLILEDEKKNPTKKNNKEQIRLRVINKIQEQAPISLKEFSDTMKSMPEKKLHYIVMRSIIHLSSLEEFGGLGGARKSSGLPRIPSSRKSRKLNYTHPMKAGAIVRMYSSDEINSMSFEDMTYDTDRMKLVLKYFGWKNLENWDDDLLKFVVDHVYRFNKVEIGKYKGMYSKVGVNDDGEYTYHAPYVHNMMIDFVQRSAEDQKGFFMKKNKHITKLVKNKEFMREMTY